MPAHRDRREYGLTPEDRAFLIARKFDAADAAVVAALLAAVDDPTDQVLGAILFLARAGRIDDLAELVRLASEDRATLLNAATVKDERG